MRQHIKGNNNQQAGNNIINNYVDDGFDPANPNIIDCPSCWKPTSKDAQECPKCGYGVVEHLRREFVLKHKGSLLKELFKIFLLIVVSTLTAITLADIYWPISVGISLGILFYAIVRVKRLEHKYNF